MDSEPFLEVDLRRVDKRDVSVLRHFEKQTFDIEAALRAATMLKETFK